MKEREKKLIEILHLEKNSLVKSCIMLIQFCSFRAKSSSSSQVALCLTSYERGREIERDFFFFFESASGRFEPTTPV